ncbi:MAG: hypothetical protein ACR2PH_04695 [Desulfobulbia bacterium]
MSDKKTQILEIEIPVFDGYEFDRISFECDIKSDEYYLGESSPVHASDCRPDSTLLIYRKVKPYKFWLPDCNMPKPSCFPEDLEILLGNGEWVSASSNPQDCTVSSYRWREDVPMEGEK